MGVRQASFELIGGVILIVGLFTRPVAFVLSVTMAVAYLYVHASWLFSHPHDGEPTPTALYSFIVTYLAAAGGGIWSVDRERAATELQKLRTTNIELGSVNS